MVSVVPSCPHLTLAGLAAAAVLAAAGCTGLDEASAAGVTHGDLISEIAGQLARVSTLTYTATYQLAGGATVTATQAQEPTRTAFAFPGGRLIETPAGTIRCEGEATALTCTESDPAPAAGVPLPGTSLVTPEAALAMLNAASLDQEITATQHDTTIAGRHATCLSLKRVDGAPTAEFSLCVTTEGALGTLTATVAGQRIDQALTAYTEEPTPAILTLPATAKLTDKRTR